MEDCDILYDNIGLFFTLTSMQLKKSQKVSINIDEFLKFIVSSCAKGKTIVFERNGRVLAFKISCGIFT